MPGRKPLAFCAWLFDCLGMRPGDRLDDWFPGTGIVSRAWAEASRDVVGDESPQVLDDVSPRGSDDVSPTAGDYVSSGAGADVSLLEQRQLRFDLSPVDGRRLPER